MFLRRPLLAVLLLVLALPASAGAPPTLELLEFVVEGNTVLADRDIERAVYPLLGPGRSLADVDQARAALEAAYQQNGYLSVSVVVPPQQIADGVVRLQVVEGQVERLKVSGNQYTSRSDLRAEVPALAPGSVPHFPTMQDQLADAGHFPDRRVTPLLRPGTRPGTMEVELAVEDDLPLHGNIEVNTRQSPDTAKYRLEAGLHYDNLFQSRHSAGLNYVVAPEEPDQVSVVAGFYSLPLSPTRSLSAFVQHSNSNIASAVGSTVVGKGTTLGLRHTWTLPTPPGAGGFFHTLAVGVDFKDLQESQHVTGADSKDTPLRYWPLVAQYTAARYGESGEVSGNLSLVTHPESHARLVNCLGVQTEQFACRRALARPGFSVLRGDLGYAYRHLGWELQTRFEFQAANQALVSPEQFLAGGMDTVRGYLEGEAAGDTGLRLKAELRTPALVDLGNAPLRAAVFAEGARLRLIDALPGQRNAFTLAGAGIGLRLKGGRGGPQFAVDLAQALRDGPRSEKGSQRVHLRLGYEF